MSRERIYTGIAGEGYARIFLRRKGYRILERNYRTPFGEIDVIARHRGVIVFVEVRSTASFFYGPAYLSIDRLKQKRIIKNGLFYLKKNGLAGRKWRIDIVSVKLDHERRPESLELIENAVEDEYV